MCEEIVAVKHWELPRVLGMQLSERYLQFHLNMGCFHVPRGSHRDFFSFFFFFFIYIIFFKF